MNPPDHTAILNAFDQAGATFEINRTRQTLRVHWPPDIDPQTRAELTTMLLEAKPAYIAWATGHCAWCHTQPATLDDHQTGWPICVTCAHVLDACRQGPSGVAAGSVDLVDAGAA